jgi:hypothetical protein
MVYRIAEGTLSLASEWQDQSINVLLPKDAKVQGVNLVISRDRLPLGMTFQDYIAQQRQTFAAQLADFDLVTDSAGQIDGREAQFMEMGWRTDGKLIHQVVATVLGDANAVMTFTGSIPGGPDDETRNQLIAAITSFRFEP